MVYIVRCNNSTVTDFYLDILGQMLQNSGETVKNYTSDCVKDKKDIIIVATVVDFFKIYMQGYRKIVFWMQGIESEESYLNHQSNMRKFILDRLTKIALTKSTAIFYVSEAMRRYEENKFKINTHYKSFVMPCFNVEQDSKLQFENTKYDENIFSYVGSLSKWQCFDETVEFYKKIEEKVPNAKLYVYTFQKEEARNILEKKKIKNYIVDSVQPEKITDALKRVKFGFVLREDIAVNNVATPTKLSSYLSAGVIPIFSNCLTDFYEKTQKMRYVIPLVDNSKLPDRLINLLDETINKEDVEKEYSNFFATYYNPQYYKNQYASKLKQLLK